MPPSLALPDCQSGSFASFAKTSTHLSTASFAMPGGPISAVQPTILSMSGQRATRARHIGDLRQALGVTNSARRAPAFTCGMTVGASSDANCTCPPSNAVVPVSALAVDADRMALSAR